MSIEIIENFIILKLEYRHKYHLCLKMLKNFLKGQVTAPQNMLAVDL